MKNSTQIVRFMIVGTSNALITALIVGVMMGVFGCNYLWSNIAGYIAALINNFIWSKYWIFTSRGKQFQREIPLFLLAFAIAYALQFLSLLLMVEIGGLNEYLAQFLGLFVYGAVNFSMNKRLTFKRKN